MMSRRFSAWIVDNPRKVIAVVILLTVTSIIGLRGGVELDASPLSFIQKESEKRTDYEAARRDFGDDLYLVLAIVADDVFSRENIAKLRALDLRIKAIHGVVSSLSVVDAPYARGIDGAVSFEKLIPAGEVSDERLSEARAVATTDRLYAGQLVSADATTAAFTILIDQSAPTRERHRITREIYDVAQTAGFAQVFFAGDPFSQLRSTEAISKDLALLLPITSICIALVLWLSFRSWVAVFVPLVTIGLGLLWLFGIMGFANARFTILALMLPTLLLAIGCSYLIHVFNQVGLVRSAAAPGDSPKKVVEEGLAFIVLPVVVSALTIIAGFLSLSFTHIPAIRETSIYAALGALCTMVLSLTFVPAVLVLLGRRGIEFSTGLGGNLVALIERVGKVATTREGWLYAVTGIVVVGSLIGMRRIQIDIDYFHFFRPGSETSVGLAEISRRLSGAVNFDVIIEGDRPGAMESPLALERLAAFQEWVEKSNLGIDRTISVADFVRHLNRAFNNNRSESYTIPQDTRIARELLSDKPALKEFLTADGRRARVLMRSSLSASRAMATAIAEIERQGQELFPGYRIYATGTLALMNATSDSIGREQVQSVTIALLTIYLMLALLFRSWRVGLTALVPNLVPVLFFFGFMGWSGISLNVTTSLVASVVLGLAVDNSVQFIVRFRQAQKMNCPVRDAIIASLRLSGRPIIYANVALAVTFAIFAFSNFQPIGSFGLLSAVTILGCLVEDLVLLPARLTSPVFRATQNKRLVPEEAVDP
ncbi:MAG: MMPL family transporter [Acidobacteriota bacterium]